MDLVVSNYLCDSNLDLNDIIERCSTDIQKLRENFYETTGKEILKSNQHNLDSLTANAEILKHAYIHLESEISETSSEVSQIRVSAEKIANVLSKRDRKISQSKARTAAIELLKSIEESLNDSIVAHRSNEYNDEVTHLLKTDIFLKELADLTTEFPDYLDTYKELHHQYEVQYEQLILELSTKWNITVRLTRIQNDAKFSINDKDSFRMVVFCLYRLHALEPKLRLLHRQLDEHLTKLLTTDDCACVITNNESSFMVEFFLCEDPSSVKKVDVVEQMAVIMQELIEILQIKEVNTNVASMMNDDVFQKYLSFMVENKLTLSIPRSYSDLEEFRTRIQELCVKLDNLFKPVDLLTIDISIINDFLSNLDEIFFQQRVNHFLFEARKFITESLFNSSQPTMFSHYSSDNSNPSKLTIENTLELSVSDNVKSTFAQLPPLFLFPRCLVSNSIESLANLMLEIIREALEQNIQECHQLHLIQSLRSIIQLFRSSAFMHHEKEITDFPQLAAIFYNNCYFIAHFCLTSVHMLSESVNSELVSLADFVPLLRNDGNKTLESMMISQSECLYKLIDSKDGFTSLLISTASFHGHTSISADLSDASKISFIKKIMIHLNHLQKILSPALPSNIYIYVVGEIIENVFSKLIQSVIAQEDISATDANRINLFFTKLLQESENLFQVSTDEVSEQEMNTSVTEQELKACMMKNVKCYMKFTETIFVLNARLKEIVNRWAGGMGPLAQEFTAEEMRNLIRALFQNTEKRSAALKEII